MGRLLLVCRLAGRSLRRRSTEAALLFVAITAATTTLTLGLVLQGVLSDPFASTRAETAGPDVVASTAPPPGSGEPADLAGLTVLAEAAGVVGHSGPYPYTQAEVGANGVTATAWAQGRDITPAPVDQPVVTDGTWVRDGGVVIEANFADALGIGAGNSITLEGRSFRVAGVAVTAASDAYPKVCFAPCWSEGSIPPPPPAADGSGSSPPERSSGLPPADALRIGPSGLVWLTEPDVRSLVSRAESLGYVLNLKLAEPDRTASFVEAHPPISAAGPALVAWQDILEGRSWLIEKSRVTVLVGSWLLGLLALSVVAVVVGTRMALQVRRVGLLKAVGGTPYLVVAMLLAEYVAVALLATAAGLAFGGLAAPLLADPGVGLLGSAGAVSFGWSTVALVAAVAIGIAGAATVVPALRASRTSTVVALADAARTPRRTTWLTGISARLPAPLLLGLRTAARRPRRTALGVGAIAITVTGLVAALATNAHRYAEKAPGSDPRTALSQALLLIAVALVAQAAVNAICICWATVVDNRQASALARALGATPGQVAAGLSVAQVLPALAGSLLGLIGGLWLAELLDDDPVTIPATWQLLAVVLGTVLLVTVLTALPARISARQSPGPVLQSER